MNKEQFFNYKTITILLSIMIVLSFLNMCNSCKSNKRLTKNEKVIENLTLSVDSNLNGINKQIQEIPKILQENDDWQTAKFLYWERKADGKEFINYTPKDYYDLIKKDK